MAEPVQAEPVVAGVASTSRTNGRRRRRVSKEEAREIGRLYAETSTPTSEIRERFGIGDSSLYRIVQQQGVPLRGRTAARSAAKSPQARTPAARRSGSPRTARATQAISQPRPTKATTATRARRSDRQQFRILFRGERVVRATDVRDALRQAQAFGAVEITAVVQVD
jgi:transposase-like protein